MTEKLFKKVRKFLPLIGIIILIFTIYRLDVGKIVNSFLSIHPFFIIIALSLSIPRVIIRNYAWQVIQKEQKIQLSYWKSLKILLIGFFYGSISPGYIGQLIRIPYMKEKTGEPYGKLFINSVVETIIHTLSLYGMIFLGALLVLSTFPDLLKIIIIWLIALAIIIFYFIKKERGQKLFNFFVKYLFPKRLKKTFYQFIETFYHDFPKISKLYYPLFLGVFTWIIIFSQYYILVIALGLSIPYIYFLLLFPVANFVSFIPVSFAGLGTRELTAIFLFSTLFAIAEEKIFVVSLLGFILTDIAAGLVGFIISIDEGRKKGLKNYSS